VGGYQALRYAVTEARRRGLPLLPVRVYRLSANGLGLLQPEMLERAAAQQVDMAFLEALGGPPRDLRIQVRLPDGAVAAALVSVADRETDLLVIGGCGRRRWNRRRHTAIARICVRDAVCPVVIVPPTALARSAAEVRLARQTARDVEDYLIRQEAHL
jgi:nucleotide-binding universal stress UspA family protein